MAKKSYRVQITLVGFMEAEHTSPQRIERRLLDRMTEILLDPIEINDDETQTFGFCRDVSVVED